MTFIWGAREPLRSGSNDLLSVWQYTKGDWGRGITITHLVHWDSTWSFQVLCRVCESGDKLNPLIRQTVGPLRNGRPLCLRYYLLPQINSMQFNRNSFLTSLRGKSFLSILDSGCHWKLFLLKEIVPLMKYFHSSKDFTLPNTGRGKRRSVTKWDWKLHTHCHFGSVIMTALVSSLKLCPLCGCQTEPEFVRGEPEENGHPPPTDSPTCHTLTVLVSQLRNCFSLFIWYIYKAQTSLKHERNLHHNVRRHFQFCFINSLHPLKHWVVWVPMAISKRQLLCQMVVM